MKIKLNTNDDNLPLDEILSFSVFSIVFKSVFQNEDKYYPQIHIHDCGYVSEYES